MLEGIHKTFNVHALAHITKPVYTPDVQLAIGEAETHASIAKNITYPYIPKNITEPELATQSYEYTQMDGFADPISEDDFPKDGVLGNAIGGF